MKEKEKKNRNLILGGFFLGIMVLLAMVSVIYTPYDPDAMNGLIKNSPPSLTHFFGTDHFGRDIFSRVMVGSRNTLLIALTVNLISSVIGALTGAVSGYFGGWFDEILMRLNDAILAFPSVLLALIVISVLGVGMNHLILAFVILFLPSYVRMMRGEVIRIKELEYINSARAIGMGSWGILWKHVLPNARSTYLASVAVGVTNGVLAESSMSYLGLGIQPPTASLGRMLAESQGYLTRAPWSVVGPGLAIIFIALGASLLSEGIREKENAIPAKHGWYGAEEEVTE